MLARQSHNVKAALGQTGVQAANIFARRAEQDSRFRLMQTQQVNDGVFDVRWGDRDHLIADVTMAAIFANGRDPQSIALIPFCQRNNRFRHGGREQQCPPPLWRSVQYFLKLFAKAHVEHFVRFIQDRDFQSRQVKRATFQMVAQPSGGADNDLRALV